MIFLKPSSLKSKLKRVFLRLFNTIENNGDCNFETNGEKVFVESLLKTLENDAVVLDIGANIGGYAELILKEALINKINVQLHLFEPTRSCFSILTKKYSEVGNVILNNVGLSDVSERSKIYYDKEKSGLASLYQRNLKSYSIELSQSEEVNVKRLDSYVEEKRINHIDFVKIDIEGHELKAFEGFGVYLDSDFIDYIQFEYGGANLDSGASLMEIYQVLSDRGFVVAKVMPTGLEVRDYSPYMDNFNYANYVAVSRNKIQ
jgi:FkbM family methyltransferase